MTESEEGRVYPNRKHLGLIQSNEKYNSVFFFLKVGRRPILFICQLSMIANATWFESIQTCTTCKNWKHCHGLGRTLPLVQRCDPNPICLRWVVCLALDNVFHFNPNNNSLTKKHAILSPGYYHFIHYFVVYFLKTSRNKSRHLSAYKMKRICFFLGPPCRDHHVSAIVGGMCKLNGYRLSSPPPQKKR